MAVKRHTEKLKDVYQTGAWIVKLIKKFNADVAKYDDWEFYDFYSLVRDLPYIDDGSDEQLSRPKYTLQDNPPFRDCDDKAIIIGCWLYRHGIPFRAIACSYKPEDEIHHCILQTKEPRMFIDATYPNEDDFPPTKNYYNIEPLSGWIEIYHKEEQIAEVERAEQRLVAGRRNFQGRLLGSRR